MLCRRGLVWVGLMACLGVGSAQTAALAPAVGTNVVHVAASGFIEVPQDWLALRMSVTRVGGDAAQVQNQLRAALDAALDTAKGAATAQALVVRSGNFGVYPRYDKAGKVSDWQGQAELVLEGRDFTLLARTASRMQPLAVSSMDFSLSREAQQQLESDVQSLAIGRFQQRAGEVAKAFGFTGYELREVSVSSADAAVGREPRHQPMSMKAASSQSDAEPLPAEPGRSQVTVTVSGSIQLK